MVSRRSANGGAPRRVRLLIALFGAVLSPCLAAASSALADQPGILDLPTSWAALANDSAMRRSENQDAWAWHEGSAAPPLATLRIKCRQSLR
jgi:hypothetical protein